MVSSFVVAVGILHRRPAGRVDSRACVAAHHGRRNDDRLAGGDVPDARRRISAALARSIVACVRPGRAGRRDRARKPARALAATRIWRAVAGVAVRLRCHLRRAVRRPELSVRPARHALDFWAVSRWSAPLASRDCCRAMSRRRLCDDDRPRRRARPRGLGTRMRAAGAGRAAGRERRRRPPTPGSRRSSRSAGRSSTTSSARSPTPADAGVRRHRPRARRRRGATTSRLALDAVSVDFAVQADPRGTADAVLAAEDWSEGIGSW